MQTTNQPPREHLGYLLTAYVFENLSAAGRAEVERHLAVCGECREQLEGLRATVALAAGALDGGAREYVFEKHRKARVMRAAVESRRGYDFFGGKLFKLSWKLGAVAALLLVAAILVLPVLGTAGRTRYFDRKVAFSESNRERELSDSLGAATEESLREASGKMAKNVAPSDWGVAGGVPLTPTDPKSRHYGNIVIDDGPAPTAAPSTPAVKLGADRNLARSDEMAIAADPAAPSKAPDAGGGAERPRSFARESKSQSDPQMQQQQLQGVLRREGLRENKMEAQQKTENLGMAIDALGDGQPAQPTKLYARELATGKLETEGLAKLAPNDHFESLDKTKTKVLSYADGAKVEVQNAAPEAPVTRSFRLGGALIDVPPATPKAALTPPPGERPGVQFGSSKVNVNAGDNLGRQLDELTRSIGEAPIEMKESGRVRIGGLAQAWSDDAKGWKGKDGLFPSGGGPGNAPAPLQQDLAQNMRIPAVTKDEPYQVVVKSATENTPAVMETRTRKVWVTPPPATFESMPVVTLNDGYGPPAPVTKKVGAVESNGGWNYANAATGANAVAGYFVAPSDGPSIHAPTVMALTGPTAGNGTASLSVTAGGVSDGRETTGVGANYYIPNSMQLPVGDGPMHTQGRDSNGPVSGNREAASSLSTLSITKSKGDDKKIAFDAIDNFVTAGKKPVLLLRPRLEPGFSAGKKEQHGVELPKILIEEEIDNKITEQSVKAAIAEERARTAIADFPGPRVDLGTAGNDSSLRLFDNKTGVANAAEDKGLVEGSIREWSGKRAGGGGGGSGGGGFGGGGRGGRGLGAVDGEAKGGDAAAQSNEASDFVFDDNGKRDIFSYTKGVTDLDGRAGGQLKSDGIALDMWAKTKELNANGVVHEFFEENVRGEQARPGTDNRSMKLGGYVDGNFPFNVSDGNLKSFKGTLQSETADASGIRHSDYLLYPENWREISQRSRRAEEEKTLLGSFNGDLDIDGIVANGAMLNYPPNWDMISRRSDEAFGKKIAEAAWKAELRKNMQRKISFEFVETPLADAIEVLRHTSHVSINIDPKVLADNPSKINLRVADMDADLALEWVLKVAELDYTFQDQAIFISKPQNLQRAEIAEHSKIANSESRLTTQASLPASGGLQTDPAIYELALRGYRHFHACNPRLSFPQYLRHPESIAPVALTDEGMDEDEYIEKYGTRPFVDCERDRLSTFAMDVDTAAYTQARGLLRAGKLPAPEAIRVEEFVNYFKQDYKVEGGEAFGVFAEAADSPFLDSTPESAVSAAAPQRELLRVGIKSRDPRPNERKPATLTFVIDTSGSMRHRASAQSPVDRLTLVKDALKQLVAALNPDDAISIVGFSEQAEMILPRTQARQRQRVIDAIDSMQANGSTNVEAGLLLGLRVADEAYALDSINRMILVSDGMSGLGARGPEELLKTVRAFAQRGVDLSTIGVGMGKTQDETLRQFADNGNGACHYADSPEEARKILLEKLPPHLEVLARDAKVQVEFNPAVVGRYRLLGYEKRKLADKDFRNDKVDAGEVAHSTLVTALYEILRKPGAHGPLGKVFLRWKDAGYVHQPVVERNYPLSEGIEMGPAAKATPEFRFIACVARFAELLRGSKWTRHGSYAEVLAQLQSLPATFKCKAEWIEVYELVTRARDLSVSEWRKELR